MKTPLSVTRLLILPACMILAMSCDSDRGREEKDEMKTVILPAGEVHEGWFFAAGQHVVIDGTVNGDVYAGAGKVDVNGTVNGDVLAAGSVVDIAGHVSDDVRAAGGSVRFSGMVGKNVTAAGGTVEIARSAVVGGGVVLAGGTVLSAGTVKKSAMFACGTAEISGSIDGDVSAAAENVQVTRGALIGGNLTAHVEAKEHVSVADGTVKGEIRFKVKEESETHEILGFSPARLWLKLFWTGGLLLTGLVLFLVSRRLFVECAARLRQQLWRSLLWGFVAVIAIPIVVIVLCVTLIGIPLGLILLATYLAVLYLSQLSLGLLSGEFIVTGENRSPGVLYGTFAAGTIVFQVLSLIPWLGALLEIAALLAGVGVVVLLIRSAATNKPKS